MVHFGVYLAVNLRVFVVLAMVPGYLAAVSDRTGSETPVLVKNREGIELGN